MKIIKTVSKEFLGEGGARLFAEFEAEREGVRLRIAKGGSLETVDFDADETARIAEVMRTSIESDCRGGGLHFDGPDEMGFSFYGDNMGEPYRRGISFWLRSPDVHAGVFLEMYEATAFSKFLEANAPSPGASPSPR